MKDTAIAARYARTPVTTFVPENVRPEQSKILRTAALLALATGIGFTVVSGHGPDLSSTFSRSNVAQIDGEQALDVLRIQAYGGQNSWSQPSYR